MLDNHNVIDTKDLAKAVQSLLALSVQPDQLKLVSVREIDGDINYIAPGLITRIEEWEFYSPDRKGSRIYYITGEAFTLDLPVENLAAQLNLTVSS